MLMQRKTLIVIILASEFLISTLFLLSVTTEVVLKVDLLTTQLWYLKKKYQFRLTVIAKRITSVDTMIK